MSDDQPPNHQHPRLSNLRSAAGVLRVSGAAFAGNLATFLFLSFILFSFRTLVEDGTHLLTSFIDRDPSLKALLSTLDLAGAGAGNNHLRRRPDDPYYLRRHNQRPPFLHLTRFGTLDDNFFSGDDDGDRSLFGANRRLSANASAVVLFARPGADLGFSDLVVDNGIMVSEVVRSGLSFKTPAAGDRDDDSSSGDSPDRSFVDFQFLLRGLELEPRDATTLFFLVIFLAVAYGWVILGFLVTHSWVLGIVFITVVNDLLSRFSSFAASVWDGSRLGLKRLSSFILMRWVVRDTLTQLIGLYYFGEIEDQYSFFKLFVRLKLMPFSVMSPWIRGFEREISGFLFAWTVLDTAVALVFALDTWIAVADMRKGGWEIVKEGCHLISKVFCQAVQIKCLEAVFCGSSVRWVLARAFGRSFAKVFQSTVEVYFMVAWLVLYLAVRCKDARLSGRSFGRRELEGLIDGLR